MIRLPPWFTVIVSALAFAGSRLWALRICACTPNVASPLPPIIVLFEPPMSIVFEPEPPMTMLPPFDPPAVPFGPLIVSFPAFAGEIDWTVARAPPTPKVTWPLAPITLLAPRFRA